MGAHTVYKPKEMDTQTARETRWSTCTLSGQPLAEPVAADFLGSLYNRRALPPAQHDPEPQTSASDPN